MGRARSLSALVSLALVACTVVVPLDGDGDAHSSRSPIDDAGAADAPPDTGGQDR